MNIRSQVFSLVAVLLLSLAGVLIRSNAGKVEKGIDVPKAGHLVPVALVFASTICGGLALWSLPGKPEQEIPQQPSPRDSSKAADGLTGTRDS